MITFNGILRAENIDPSTVLLVRHQDGRSKSNRTPYSLWRTDPEALELYQRIQSKDRFPLGSRLASFVGTPSGETLFTGLYAVVERGFVPPGTIDPVSAESVEGLHLYTLDRDPRLDAYRGLLVVDWGQGFRSWIQKAQRQDKPILELRRTVADPPFPGFTEFRHDVDTIEAIPESWKEVLRSVKGVYVLACKETGKLYVGSAKGEESLWGRFADYAASGHGGNVELKKRGKRTYQVSVLEVTNSAVGIERLEELWKRKLMSREHGLNDPVFSPDLEAISAFAEKFADRQFSFGEWAGGETKDGATQMPWLKMSDDAMAFVKAAYDGRWILDGEFSWVQWKESEEARRLFNESGRIEKANVRQLARLLTALIRSDHFAEGTLNGAFQSGLLPRIVRRAAVLAGSLTRADPLAPTAAAP
ncbi:GIY-YIG nuclease family protein [Mesorhizobium onobrychidis]|uniref:GIY-YIG nuclease family protein n=1 Tax=Mesorhizobium onobrychidis TaxID=2775404 RepID=A0ABY5R850_9HYPH|nr:GIY-YIG nuclease family protein [Mesorhizobium onobrychidis]UVC19369.1 GIY-YIG nuclease family protein [Mesorhizobium onobrychidis]